MRISVRFTSNNKIALPISYNHMLQAFIYKHIDEKLGRHLHDGGFSAVANEKRKFKLFTFSRIIGNVSFEKEKGVFRVKPPFEIIVSSPVKNLIQSLAETLVRVDVLQLNKQDIYLKSINVYFMPSLNSEMLVSMLSPVTIYSTLSRPEGKKKTYYYSPFEKEFSMLLEKNARAKYQALYNMDPGSLSFEIEPVGIQKEHEKIIEYKGTIIKGWMGQYRLKGSTELMALTYDAGLGSKNSQGFGCFEILGEKAR